MPWHTHRLNSVHGMLRGPAVPHECCLDMLVDVSFHIPRLRQTSGGKWVRVNCKVTPAQAALASAPALHVLHTLGSGVHDNC